MKAAFHEVLKMRFFDVSQRFIKGELGCDMAADILGVSVSTFYRMRKRYEDEGESGLVDRRIGRLSSRRVPADEAMRLISLYETKYYDFTVKHFHEKLPEHGFKLSYTCVKNKLQDAGVVKRAKKRGQHRRKRVRKPLPGMMIHQDGSTHEWVAGKKWDLIITMDDATSECYSMFFCEEEGTMSSFLGLREMMDTHGLACSLYVDRASQYFFTEQAGGKVSTTHLTQVGRAMRQLGIEMIPAYSPEARGRCERMFGTLQKRLPQELRVHGITDMKEANHFLRERFLPEHNARFTRKAEQPGSAFTPLMGFALDAVLCIQEERVVAKDNTLRYKGKSIQILEDASRCSYAKCKVRIHEYLDGTLAVFHGPRKLPTAIIRPTEEYEEADSPDALINWMPEPGRNHGEGAAAAAAPSPDTGYAWRSALSPVERYHQTTKNISAPTP